MKPIGGFVVKFSKMILLGSLALSACTTTPRVGELPGSAAPQLVREGRQDASGRELLRWDRPGAFGRVTGTQKITGDIACMMAGIEFEAIGYHPKARDVSGKEMPGGGYYCAAKANGDKPDATAPRLVRTDGLLGWDRPSAFGRVPEQARERGNRICQQANPNFQAIGYHPFARLENGNAIIDGGFFCVPKPRQ